MKLQSFGPNSKQEALTKNTCKSPTRLTDTKASSRVVLSNKGWKLATWRGSNRGPQRALRTVDRSQIGTVWGQDGLRLLALLSMEGVCPLSSSSFKKNKWSLAHMRMGLRFGLHTSQRRWTNLGHRGNLLLEKGDLSSAESARELSMTAVLGRGATTGFARVEPPVGLSIRSPWSVWWPEGGEQWGE